jgi:hypothetical protein
VALRQFDDNIFINYIKKYLKLFLCQSDEEEDQEATICGWAYNAEKIIHGNPSGNQ